MSKNKKNILITGGAGFIGSNLALSLFAKGYSVTVLDILSAQIHGENPEIDSSLYQSILGKVNFIKGDITNIEDVKKSLVNQDAVIHLAAETGTGQSMYEMDKYSRVNSNGTAVLLDVLINEPNFVKKIVLASSRAVYGEGKYKNSQNEFFYPKQRSISEMQNGFFEMVNENGEILSPVGTDEESVLHPASFYGLTKLQQEQMVKLVCETRSIDYVILRYQNVFGDGQALRNPYTGILSVFSNQILSGKSLNVFEDGLPSRDFIYIDDVVEATIRSLEMDSTSNETINIGTGVSTSVLEVAKLLAKKYKIETEINISGDFRIGDIRHNFADLSKMKKLLGFAPRISFEEGLDKFTNWVSNQTIPDNFFEKSLEEMKNKGFLKS
jgi:dTDP-L-rhamnose 4-epimerase